MLQNRSEIMMWSNMSHEAICYIAEKGTDHISKTMIYIVLQQKQHQWRHVVICLRGDGGREVEK